MAGANDRSHFVRERSNEDREADREPPDDGCVRPRVDRDHEVDDHDRRGRRRGPQHGENQVAAFDAV